MTTLLAAVHRHPLVTFYALACALTWLSIALMPVSAMLVLLGLWGPALAAGVVLGITRGGAGVRELLRRLLIWRVGARWYAVVVGLPIVLAGTVVALHLLLGGVWAFRPVANPLLMLVLALLVVGEELGWRGFALPRLQARYSGLVASLILGVLWAAWHLGNAAIPGLERYWHAFGAFCLWVIAQTVLFTFVANHTRGSVLLAWLFHAAINVSGGVFALPDPVRQWWLSAAVYGAAALAVVLLEGPGLLRRPEVPLLRMATPTLSK